MLVSEIEIKLGATHFLDKPKGYSYNDSNNRRMPERRQDTHGDSGKKGTFH